MLAGIKYTVPVITHDEVVSEVGSDLCSLEEFLAIMKTSPDWADGLPIAVDGWQGERYRK